MGKKKHGRATRCTLTVAGKLKIRIRGLGSMLLVYH